MLLNEVFPSKYIKAPDLKGREVTVVISEVVVEKIGDDRKLVVYFQGKERGLVTNKTNANRIALMYGEDTDQWTGREIVLGTDFVDFQGKTVEAIRVKPPARRQQAQQDANWSERKTGSGATIIDREPPDDIAPPMGNGPRTRASASPDPDDDIPFAPEWR